MGKYYIAIKNPYETRNNLISCTKGMMKSLQNYEDYNSIKQKKRAYIDKLKMNIEEINRLGIRLKEILPEQENEIRRTNRMPKDKEDGIKELSNELDYIEKKLKRIK